MSIIWQLLINYFFSFINSFALLFLLSWCFLKLFSINNNVSLSNIGPLDNIEYYLVHAGDLVEVVNALKNAGAEAISINGQRITNSTAIYCAGNVVKVNGEKISSPIEIKAIGSPELLYGSMTIPGGYIELLEETGVIVDIKKSTNITINKFDGIINSQYIKSE